MIERRLHFHLQLCQALHLAVARSIALDNRLVIVGTQDLSGGEVEEDAAHRNLKVDNGIFSKGESQCHEVFLFVLAQHVGILESLGGGHGEDGYDAVLAVVQVAGR